MYKVIIIDDEPEIAKVTKSYVEKNMDFVVKAVFSNGQEALNYIWLNTVDLIILDLYMPEMSGKDFLYRLRKENINIDVIVVTAAIDVNDFKGVIPFGVLDYILKPFDSERFSETLNKFIQRRMVIGASNMLTQQKIDSMLSGNLNDEAIKSDELKNNGLQPKTYELIKNFLIENSGSCFTAECISDKIGLSKVTIRRYMNYMAERNQVACEVDYNTGGRPSLVYKSLL